jgi:hypothetical protein
MQAIKRDAIRQSVQFRGSAYELVRRTIFESVMTSSIRRWLGHMDLESFISTNASPHFSRRHAMKSEAVRRGPGDRFRHVDLPR